MVSILAFGHCAVCFVPAEFNGCWRRSSSEAAARLRGMYSTPAGT
jgi:hypothetical protein